MVQGSAKLPKRVVSAARQNKLLAKKQQSRKGSQRQLPKTSFRDEAIKDRELSKAIDKASEQKCAAK